jgi:hypothetical protein
MCSLVLLNVACGYTHFLVGFKLQAEILELFVFNFGATFALLLLIFILYVLRTVHMLTINTLSSNYTS